jgi:hypothetical protein
MSGDTPLLPLHASTEWKAKNFTFTFHSMYRITGGDIPPCYKSRRYSTLWRSQQFAMDRMRRPCPHYNSNILLHAYCSLRIARCHAPSQYSGTHLYIYHTQYILLVVPFRTVDRVHVAMRLWAWTQMASGSYPGSAIRYPDVLLCLPQTLQVKVGVVPATGHDYFLAMLYKSSTSHHTRSKIQSVWTQQFTYIRNQLHVSANIQPSSDYKTKRKYSQLRGFGYSQLTGELLYKNTWQWYVVLELT